MTQHPPVDIEDRVRRALAAIDVAGAADLLQEMVGVPSPTGHEAPLARRLTSRLRDQGIDARVQTIRGDQANVLAELPHSARPVPTYLLYGQLDTVFHGDTARDAVLTGGQHAPEFEALPHRFGDWLSGVGAENPKGYLAATVTAFEALARAGFPMRSRVVLALCAGGMPALPVSITDHTEQLAGFGVGCRAALEELGPIDGAIVAKPGFAVGWEEVGIAIFRLRVEGDLDYTGIRHRSPSTSAIRTAALVVEELERWFPEYSSTFATQCTAPQGAVVAVTAGDPGRPAFLPATADVYLDLRVAPGCSLMQVRAALDDCLERVRQVHGANITAQLLFGVPGATTDPKHLVVRSAITAWESMTGATHLARGGTSGYTDAVTLRLAGVPTARVGMPRPPDPSADASRFSMGRVHIPSILTLSEWLIRILLLLDDFVTSSEP